VGGNGDARQALARIAGQIRRVPDEGLGYRLLRYMSPDAGIRARIREAVARAEVVLNYLGNPSGAGGAALPFEPASESPGPIADPATPRGVPLHVTALVEDGRLRMNWVYGGRRYRRETIESLAGSTFEELRWLLS
jgi:non-ribosomal peptide synthase protein (TIGR01720 family)